MRTFLIVLCLSLAACATLPSDAPRFAAASTPPAGMVNVYIYRAERVPIRIPTVRIDDKIIFRPAPGAYTVIPLTPGPHRVAVNWPWDMATSNVSKVITIEADSSAYLKISSSFSLGYQVVNLSSDIEQTSVSDAEAELTKCCRYVAPESN